MNKSKNSKEIQILLNHKNYNNQVNKNFDNELQNEKEENIEIIIELDIPKEEKENEIYILCDKNQLIKDNEKYDIYYKENNINPPKEFNYFNKKNTKLYLNDNEIEFNYKLKFNEIGKNKIKIKSNINLFSLSTMFYNCNKIINIKFIKFNTNNIIDMNNMFYSCYNLSQ